MKIKTIAQREAATHSDRYFFIAVSLVVGLTATWALSAMGFLVGLSIARWQSIGGILTALLCLALLQDDKRERWLSTLFFVGILVSALAISTITVDKSWDGWAYHQLGAISLANGWNPVREPLVHAWFALNSSALGYPADASLPNGIWTSFYPKASWILASQPMIWGLSLDSGKFPGMLLIFVSGMVSFRALRVRGLPACWSYLLAVLVALNPVALAQATTYYVDGLLGSCLSILIFSLLSFDRTRNSLDLLLVICASLIASNLKFTGPIYTFLIVFPSLLWWLWKKRIELQHWLMLGAGLLIMATCSVNPYFTNMRIGGSPIHPLNRIDVMQYQMSPEFLEKDRISKLLISLTFSNIADQQVLNLSSPLQSRGTKELHKFVTSVDLRIGGFGPVFGLALGLVVLAAGLFGLLTHSLTQSKNDVGFLLIIFGVVMSIAVNSEMWWARYVPQMWILPILASASIIQIGRYKWIALAIVGLIGLTSLVSLGGWTASTLVVSARYKDSLNKITNKFLLVQENDSQRVFLPALAYRLRDQGIALRLSDKVCENPIELGWIKGCSSDVNIAR